MKYLFIALIFFGIGRISNSKENSGLGFSISQLEEYCFKGYMIAWQNSGAVDGGLYNNARIYCKINL